MTTNRPNRVLIVPFKKNKDSSSFRRLWFVMDAITKQVLKTEHSLTEAIFQVEEEGWILEPTN